jgi:16S rRNA (guanine527-N7)-methyltransferase
MEDIQKKYSLLYDLNISRETCIDFESLITMIQDKNQEINIVSKETAKDSVIRERHIIDSAQIYDLIDLNHNTTIDLGTGGGMPGIVVAIIMKNLKKNIKINLYEKSHHKSFFLREVSRKLELKTEVFEENIFDVKGIETGSIMARAFKPIPVILDLVHSNFKSFENIIIFMGKNGKEILKETLKGWDLEYTEKKSLTSEESFLLNIKNIKKK